MTNSQVYQIREYKKNLIIIAFDGEIIKTDLNLNILCKNRLKFK